MSIEASRKTLGDRFSEGARLLWQVMAERGWSQGELARAVGAKAGVIPRWLYGDTKPSWDWAVKLRDALGIALEAWALDLAGPFTTPDGRVLEAPTRSLESESSGAELSLARSTGI